MLNIIEIVRGILPDLSEDKLQELETAVVGVGVETQNDLQLVVEKDLVPVITRISADG